MKLLISGYFGFGNEGDEWILEALLAALKPEGHAVTVLSADPPATQARHGVRAVDRWHPGVLARELARCDALVFGGGGLIQDFSGPWTPAYYLGLQAAARALGKRVLWLGQGLGPVQRKWNAKLAQWLLPGADHIVVRDEPGRNWCARHQVPPEKITLGADWVWTLPAPRVRPGKLWAVCPRADFMNAAARRLLGDLRAQARRQGRSLRWVVLGNRGDEAWLRAFALEQGIPGEHLWFLGGLRFAEAAKRLAGVERMFSLRYHGVVLGAAAGASVAGWGPDPKLLNLLADLGALAPGEDLRPAWQMAAKGRTAALRRRAMENRRVLAAWLRKAEG